MTLLEEITRAKGWLDEFRPLPGNIAQELKQRFEVRLTHHSTAIEGNTLTQSETQIVLEKGVTIGGKSVAEHLEVIGHRDALEWVMELASSETPITERSIRELHSLVMKGLANGQSGAYRTLNVMAAGTEFLYPDYLQVSRLMAEFLEWWNKPSQLHPVLWAAEAHLRFVTIHPFQDGNGRLGRLLLNLALLRFGYPIAVIQVQRRPEYINALVQAQSGQGQDLLEQLVMEAVEASLRETLEVCASARPDRVLNELTIWLQNRGCQ